MIRGSNFHGKGTNVSIRMTRRQLLG